MKLNSRSFMRRFLTPLTAGFLGLSLYSGIANATNVNLEVASLTDDMQIEETITTNSDVFDVKVQSGDTVDKFIWDKCDIAPTDELRSRIVEENGLKDANTIFGGQDLKIYCSVPKDKEVNGIIKEQENNKASSVFYVPKMPELGFQGPKIGISPKIEVETLAPLIVDNTGILARAKPQQRNLEKVLIDTGIQRAQSVIAKDEERSDSAKPRIRSPNKPDTEKPSSKRLKTMLASNEGENKIHIVQSGDTMTKIADNYGLEGDLREIFFAQVSNPNLISVGQVLYLGDISEEVIRKANYGFLPGDIEGNRQIVYQKSPEEIKDARFGLGINKFGNLLGYRPGNFAKDKRSLDLLTLHYSKAQEAVMDNSFQKWFKGDLELAIKTALAIEKQESGGDCFSGSKTGALGCVHALADTAIIWGVNPFRVESIEGKVRALNDLIGQYGVKLGITAYNFGSGNMDKAIEIAKEQEIALGDKDKILNVKYSSGTVDDKGNDISGQYVLSKEARNFYRKVIAKRKEIESEEIFDLANYRERDTRIAVIDNLGYIDTYVLPDGNVERYIPKERYNRDLVDLAYREKLMTSTMIAGLPVDY